MSPRHMTQNSLVDTVFQLEEWRVEPRLGRMVRDQVVVTLRPRVMEALTFLAGRPGEVVSKRDLVDAVWSSGFVADNTIVHCINELRDALGDSATAPRFLQTIPRRGYRMLGRVSEIEDEGTSVTFEEAGFHLMGKRWAAFLIDGDNLIGRGGEARIIVPSTRVSATMPASPSAATGRSSRISKAKTAPLSTGRASLRRPSCPMARP